MAHCGAGCHPPTTMDWSALLSGTELPSDACMAGGSTCDGVRDESPLMAVVFAITQSRNSQMTVFMSAIVSLIATSSSFKTDACPGVGLFLYTGAGNNRLGVSLSATKLVPAHALMATDGVARPSDSLGKVMSVARGVLLCVSISCKPPSDGDGGADSDVDDDEAIEMGDPDGGDNDCAVRRVVLPALIPSSADMDALRVFIMNYMCFIFSFSLFAII